MYLPGWKSGWQDFPEACIGLCPENSEGGENLPKEEQDQGPLLKLTTLVLQAARLIVEFLGLGL